MYSIALQGGMKMKMMIASDIHGSAYYCEKMLKRFEEERCDRLILLGDILYHGPRNALPKEYDPMKVASMLNAYGDRILCVRGNCDAEIDQMVITFPILAEYAVMIWNGRLIYMTHGHVFNLDNLPPLVKGDILLHGHTHVPAWTQTDKCLYLNPGSVSIPKEGSLPGYMLIKDDGFVFKDIDGNEYHTIKP